MEMMDGTSTGSSSQAPDEREIQIVEAAAPGSWRTVTRHAHQYSVPCMHS